MILSTTTLRAIGGLIVKDWKSSLWTLFPGFALGVGLLIVLCFTRSATNFSESQVSDLWAAFFVASILIFQRSFHLESASKAFFFYRQIKASLKLLFIFQFISQALRLFIIGIIYWMIQAFFFSSPQIEITNLLVTLGCISLSISSLGVLFGLILAFEKDLLFSLLYLPTISPLMIAAYQASSGHQTAVWLSIMGSFGIISLFLSLLIFEFFFDELTQNT